MDELNEGLFITFEGIEGCGKSTQAKMLYEHLIEEGYKVEVTREPGATPVGRVIRDTLLSTRFSDMDAKTELMLFAACRAQHVTETIRPALAEGKIVVCDRYVDSTIAYQAYGRGLPIIEVQMISDLASGGVLPGLTFLLDMRVEDSFKRINGEKMDRIELADRDFHERVYNGFHDQAKRYPDRFLVLDATLPVKEIHGLIVKVVERYL